MRITLASVLVDDQERALAFDTNVLGFMKRTNVPAGKYRWLTVVSAEGPEDVELLLEPNDSPAARAYLRSIYGQGAPATAFAVRDLRGEYERMKNLGVRFTQESMTLDPVTRAVLDDAVDNLIQIYEVTEVARTPTANAARDRPALERLNPLVGTWTLQEREDGGGVHGTHVFEWMEGGYFLLQHVDLNHTGRPVKGLEIIGYGRDREGKVPKDCTSHFFDSTGNHFEYVYEVCDDTITIWGGYGGSPAAFRGKVRDVGATISGRWDWPGGGDDAVMTRA